MNTANGNISRLARRRFEVMTISAGDHSALPGRWAFIGDSGLVEVGEDWVEVGFWLFTRT
jgi:hypothetical protein